MVLIIDELDISADQLFEDVIKNSVQMKSSLLSEKIQHLPIDGQKFILSVLAVLIQEIEKRFWMHGETNYGYEEPNARKTYWF